MTTDGDDNGQGARYDGARQRLDRALVAAGLYGARERAQAAIAAGLVQVDGRTVTRASHLVAPGAYLFVRGDPVGFVGRGGVKLAAALDHFGLAVVGLTALDVGASTGGFTHCLLQRGVRRVYAVDVGRDQLAPELRQDPRVVSLEQTDIRALTALPGAGGPVRADLAVVDVAFISLTLVLPALPRLLVPGAPVLALVKPQFELGPKAVSRRGVVRDPRRRERAVQQVLAAAQTLGYTAAPAFASPLPGGAGNVEFFVLLRP